jgi:hypothetical protein
VASPTDRPNPRRVTGFALVALAVTLAVATGIAAVQPKVESPHGKFKGECSMCHTADSWKIAKIKPSFDHSKYGFPLAGAHAAAGCLSCHGSLEFAQAKTQCISCHNDPHRGELGADCARCHGARSFLDRGPMVRAHQMTRFPLTGGHATLDCESCHKPAAQGQMQFVGTSAQCDGCHMQDYQSVKTPDHVAGQYPTTCQNCHSTVSWSGANFNHDATGFALTGAHRTTACVQCHVNGRYAGTPKDCASCHTQQYNAATPNHVSSGFAAAACASCHNTTQWAGAIFDHNTTSFPLTGAHVGAACSSCHSDGVYNGKSTACYSCHQTQYAGASPPHNATSFPTAQCASCHNTTSWDNANFNHAATGFALTGAHSTTPCTSCHVGGVYAGTATACSGCHMTQYNAATPNHLSSGFSASACASCHTTTQWAGAVFDHNTTSFPLTGAHTTTACSGCHSDGVYNGKSTACYSCHQAQYASATPVHLTANFPTAQCGTCHNTTQWAGARIDHDGPWFPIYSGKHNGRWNACTDCHTSNTSYAVYTCLSCHPHDDKASTDSHHSGVRNYQYLSSACYSCHPRGSN